MGKTREEIKGEIWGEKEERRDRKRDMGRNNELSADTVNGKIKKRRGHRLIV